MRNGFINCDHSIIINYSAEFNDSCERILSSQGFRSFLSDFLKNLAVRDITVFSWLTNGRGLDEMLNELIKLAKQLLVLETDEISSSYFQGVNRLRAEYILQESYKYWLNRQRFAIVYETSNNVLAFSSAVEADNLFNQAVAELYKRLQQKLLGNDMNVVHMLQSGTNSVLLLSSYKWTVPSDYTVLKGLPFIKTAVIKTPLMYKYPTSYEKFVIDESDSNLIRQCHINRTDWLCAPILCGKLLCYCYFHIDFIGAVVALLNLFELADQKRCLNSNPDMIIVYGAKDEENSSTVYQDEINCLWYGKISYSEALTDVRYLENMILNIASRIIHEQGNLVVNGCLLDIYCKDNYARSVIILGDIDVRIFAVSNMMKKYSIMGKEIDKVEIVYYRHGQINIENDTVTSCGLLTGRILEMNQLSSISQYSELSHSVFYNPDKENALAIVPTSMYRYIMSPRTINKVILLNDYGNTEVISRLADVKMPTGIIDTDNEADYAESFCKQLISILND